ncbi:heavy metal-associated domain-containing protein [Streptococcus pneumoniae]
MKQTLQLNHLSCDHCVSRVTERFLALSGVTQVTVDLPKQVAFVETNQAYTKDDYQAALAKTIYQVLDVS